MTPYIIAILWNPGTANDENFFSMTFRISVEDEVAEHPNYTVNLTTHTSLGLKLHTKVNLIRSLTGTKGF